MEELTKENLYTEYYINKLGIRKIAEKYNMTKYAATKLLSEYGYQINESDNVKNKCLTELAKPYSIEFYQNEYITSNHSYSEIAEKISNGMTKSFIEKYIHEVLKLTKPKELSIEKAHQELYKKHSIEELTDKRKKSMCNRYNAENPSQIEEFNKKRKEAFLKKYGVDNPFAAELVKDKIKVSYQEKYQDVSITNPSQVPGIKKKQ